MARKIRIWVDDDFKKMLKAAAARRNQSMLDFTKKLAKEKNENVKKPILPLW